MGRTSAAVQVPGAPSPETPETDSGPAIDPKDAEIAALRAELAAARGVAPTEQMVMEGTGPNIRKAMAESKHRDYTSAELDKLVRSGEIKLTDHHVLCKDGWYVNPDADKRGREG